MFISNFWFRMDFNKWQSHFGTSKKNPLITPSTDYIDDFVDDISGMFNIYEIIISIHALQFMQLRPILMMTVY